MVIALADWYWSGHHPTYFTEYALALAGLGHRVLPLCADPADFQKRLGQKAASLSGWIEPAEPLSFPAPSRMRPARWRGIHDGLRLFGGLGKRLRRWERQNRARVDMVFFACMYDRIFRHFRLAQPFFRFPCAGMYMEARFFRMPGVPIPFGNGMPCPDRFLPARAMKGIAVLDESLVAPIRSLTGGKNVVVFPDVTHEADVPPGDAAEWLARRAREFANGRRIVALLGHLQWTKGLEEFTAAARHQEMREVVFLLGGEVNWSEITPERRQALTEAWASTPNLLAHLESLPEPVMNAAMAASDVVFAAYRSFPNNSNILTKAAVCRKPVVVSDGHLMARSVREFGLGEVAPEGDVEELVASLRRMAAPGYAEEVARRARWDEYRSRHAASRLPECFRRLLGAESQTKKRKGDAA